jgi:hypothetical protein
VPWVSKMRLTLCASMNVLWGRDELATLTFLS